MTVLARTPGHRPYPVQFKIERPAFARHYDIQSYTSRGTDFVAEISKPNPSKPDITFHWGRDIKGPVAAVATMSTTTRAMEIGIPSASEPNSISFRKLYKEPFSSEHHFSAFAESPPSGKGTADNESDQVRKTVAWKSTRSVVAEGHSRARFGGRCFKLVDTSSHEIVAVFTKTDSFLDCGILQVNTNYGADFEKMIIATFITMYERLRRTMRGRSKTTGELESMDRAQYA